MLINLPNGIGKIKNKQDMHVRMCTRPVYHRSFEPFEYFIAEGSKAKLNIRTSHTTKILEYHGNDKIEPHNHNEYLVLYKEAEIL